MEIGDGTGVGSTTTKSSFMASMLERSRLKVAAKVGTGRDHESRTWRLNKRIRDPICFRSFWRPLCPRRPPAKSACLEGPILEAHIGTLHSPAVSHLLSDTTFPQLGILRVPLFVPVLAGFLLRTTQVRSAPVSNWQPLISPEVPFPKGRGHRAPAKAHVLTVRPRGFSSCCAALQRSLLDGKLFLLLSGVPVCRRRRPRPCVEGAC